MTGNKLILWKHETETLQVKCRNTRDTLLVLTQHYSQHPYSIASMHGVSILMRQFLSSLLTTAQKYLLAHTSPAYIVNIPKKLFAFTRDYFMSANQNSLQNKFVVSRHFYRWYCKRWTAKDLKIIQWLPNYAIVIVHNKQKYPHTIHAISTNARSYKMKNHLRNKYTFRPLFVLNLLRNPNLRFRRRLLGWYSRP